MKKKGEPKPARPFEGAATPSEAGPAAEADAGGADMVSVLVFEIGGEPFAIRVEGTEGVVDCPRLSPLPNSPEGLIGVGSVRGRMTLAFDLSPESASRAAKQRLILLRGEAQLGLLADYVEGVVALTPKHLHKSKSGGRASTPQPGEGKERSWKATSHFKHAGRRVPIIDVDQLAEA